MLKRDVGEGDSGVADVEGSAGGLLQPATAVEKVEEGTPLTTSDKMSLTLTVDSLKMPELRFT